MNKRSRKTKGLSHRLIALLLCCFCLLAAMPGGAVAFATDAEPAAAESAAVQPAESQSEGSAASETSQEPESTVEPSAEATEPAVEPSAETTESAAEPTESAEESVEKSAADRLFERLVACATMDELNDALDNLTDEEQDLLDQFTEEQNAELEAKMESLGGYAVDTLDNRTLSIQQGGSASVEIDNMSSLLSYTCADNTGAYVPGITASLERGARNQVKGYKVTVDTSVAQGTYTLTVNYKVSDWFFGWFSTPKSDTVTVTVTEAKEENAQVYYLKTPTSDPDSNDTSEWGSCIGNNGRVKIGGATWVNNKNVFNPGTYVTDMPEGVEKQADGSWFMPKSNYNEHYKTIFRAYKTQLENELSVELEENDIEAIYLIPYKISKENGTSPDKHIDCKVSIKTSKVYAAVFWVETPNGEMTQVDAKNYKKTDGVAKTNKAPTDNNGKYPATMEVDGVTYKFDGWYNEAGEKISDDDWAYTPTEAELADGTVNFYAKYVEAYTTVTVGKVVSGNMGDQNKEFTFTVDGNSKTDEAKTFKLKHGNQKEITVGVGDIITITETSADGYTASYQIDEEEARTGNAAIIEVGQDGAKVVFTNTKDVTIDTGVVLDKLPYILILVIVAAGIVVVSRRRKSRAED